MKCVALFRVSSDAQAERGASLESQQRRYRELAALNGWTTVAEVRGSESASGANADRELLGAVVRAADEHQADAVYVHEQSRLSRGDEVEWGLLMRELRRRGVKVIVNGIIRDPASIDDGFMFRIQAAVDRAEVERFTERTQRGKREKARQGRRIAGGPPFGFTGGGRSGPLQILEDEAAVVREAFALFAAGRSLRDIAHRLGIAKTSLAFLLDNPAYVGETAAFRFKRGQRGTIIRTPERAIVTEGTHPPIVDRETWELARSRRERKVSTGGRPSMLRGLLWLNGSEAIGTSGHGRYHYGVRQGPQVNRSEVEGIVWQRFQAVLESPAFVTELEAAEVPSDIQQRSDQSPVVIDRLTRRLDRLAVNLADGDIDRATYRRLADETRARIGRLRTDLGPTSDRLRPVTQRVAETLAMLTLAAPHQRRGLLDAFVARIDATAERVGDFARAENGRVLPGRGPHWRLDAVSFRCRASDTSSTRCVQTAVTAVVWQGGSPVLTFRRVPVAPLPASREVASG